MNLAEELRARLAVIGGRMVQVESVHRPPLLARQRRYSGTPRPALPRRLATVVRHAHEHADRIQQPGVVVEPVAPALSLDAADGSDLVVRDRCANLRQTQRVTGAAVAPELARPAQRRLVIVARKNAPKRRVQRYTESGRARPRVVLDMRPQRAPGASRSDPPPIEPS